MKLTIRWVGLVLLVFVSASLVETKHGTRVRDGLNSRGNLDFASALYSKLASSRGNIFFSPLSVQTILALAYLGARGKTAQQMAAGLHLTANPNDVKTYFQQLLKGIANSTDTGAILEIANRIYLSNKFHVKDEFNKVAKRNFLSKVETVDFSLGEKTAKVINGWVGKKTHGKIKDIISKEDLNSDISSVLVNAVYFKGKWKHSFDKSHTFSSRFHVTANKTKKIKMMTVKAEASLVKSRRIRADILEFPYKGNTISLVVILPFKVDGLAEVEKKLDVKTIFASLNEREPVQVQVQLPRFKLKESLNLNDHLKALGMTEMFEGTADFSGMSDSGSSVSEVLHKAFIEVNEEGTEAAAATSILLIGRSASIPVPHFVADHPFVFLLRHKPSGSVLFMGRFADPEGSG